MSTYLSKRSIYMFVILFAASLLIFCLYALTPGDFICGNIKLTPERKAELREIYGLNKPVSRTIWIWMSNAFHGDFGYSLSQQQPVLHLVQRVYLEFIFTGDCFRLFDLADCRHVGVVRCVQAIFLV